MKISRFTLIEILVVIMLILLLAALLFPVIKSVYLKAEKAKTVGMLHDIKKALNEYKAYHGFFPQTSSVFELDTNFFDDAHNWKPIPKYVGKTPSKSYWTAKYGLSGIYLIDPYDGHIFYKCPGVMNPETYDLWSMGPNKGHGDEDDDDDDIANAQNRNDNDDITNWKNDFE